MDGFQATVAVSDAQTAIERLHEARERTLELVAPYSDDELEQVHSTLMSPLVWDLGHIAAFEDLWIVHRFGGESLLREELADVYDAFETPRAGRGDLPFLRPPEARDYLQEVRERALEVIERRGVGDGIIAELIVRHEQQHTETMLQTIQLAQLEGLSEFTAAGPAGLGGTGTGATPGSRRGALAHRSGARRDPGRPVPHRRSRRRLCLRQRAAPSSHRRPRVPDRPHADHQRHVPDVCGRGWVRAA